MSAAARSGFVADLVTPPNLITLSRIALLLVAAGLFFAGHERVGIALAVIGGLTDYLDGWLARRTGKVTRLGEILDQFSDIFFESLVLYIACAQFHFLPLWVLTAYLAREFWVTSIRRFMAAHQLNIASSMLGKLKTNFIMWGFFPTYLAIEDVIPPATPFLTYLGRGAIALGLCFGYASGWSYSRQLVAGYNRVAAGAAGGPPPLAANGAAGAGAGNDA